MLALWTGVGGGRALSLSDDIIDNPVWRTTEIDFSVVSDRAGFRLLKEGIGGGAGGSGVGSDIVEGIIKEWTIGLGLINKEGGREGWVGYKDGELWG